MLIIILIIIICCPIRKVLLTKFFNRNVQSFNSCVSFYFLFLSIFDDGFVSYNNNNVNKIIKPLSCV